MNQTKIKVGDIVDWTVIGSGGPGWVVGTLRCEVTGVYLYGHECSLKPLDWDKAEELFIREGSMTLDQIMELRKEDILQNCGVDECELVKQQVDEEQVDEVVLVREEFPKRVLTGTLDKLIRAWDKLGVDPGEAFVVRRCDSSKLATIAEQDFKHDRALSSVIGTETQNIPLLDNLDEPEPTKRVEVDITTTLVYENVPKEKNWTDLNELGTEFADDAIRNISNGEWEVANVWDETQEEERGQ